MIQANLAFREDARQLVASGYLVRTKDDFSGSGISYYARNFEMPADALSTNLARRLRNQFDFASDPSPCALAMAQFILSNPSEVLGKRVVEIGAGSGVVAISAAQAGAAEIVTIDPCGGELIELNAEINGVGGRITIHSENYQSPKSREYIGMADILFMSRLYTPYAVKEQNAHVQKVLLKEWERGATIFISAITDAYDQGWDQLSLRGEGVVPSSVDKTLMDSSHWVMFKLPGNPQVSFSY